MNKKLRRIKKYINVLKNTRKDWHCRTIYKMRAYVFSQLETETFISNNKCEVIFFAAGIEIDRIAF